MSRFFLLLYLALLGTSVPAIAVEPEDFNVFSLSYIDLQGSDFEGRAGALGDVRFQDFSLGEKAPRTSATLIVGGSATLRDGSILHGGVRAGGRISRARVDIHGLAVSGENDASLACVARKLQEGSARLAALQPDVFASWDQGLVVSAHAGQSVASLSSAELTQSSVIKLRVPEGSTLILNVLGEEVSLTNLDLRLEGAGTVVFDLAQARRLRLEGIRLPAVVLAPRADTVFTSGAVDGRLYVGGLRGDGQVNEKATPGTALLFGPEPCP